MASNVSLCPATSPEVIKRLGVMFGRNSNQAQSRLYDSPVGTIQALGNCSRVGTLSEFTDDKCLTVKLWWLDDSQFDEDSVYLGDEFNPDADCDVEEGCQLTSKCFEHKPNLYADKTVTVCDSKCDSEIDFATESAAALAAGMDALRVKLNSAAINMLADCATSTDGLDECPAEIFTFNGTKVCIDKATIKAKDDVLAEMSMLAKISGIQDYKIHTGRTWGSDVFSIRYKKLSNCCGDDAATATALEDLLSDMITFDVENMYTELGEKSMFLWNPSNVGYYNFAYYPLVPTLVDSTRDIWHWRVQDPKLVWSRNVYSMDGIFQGVQTVPVEYDIEYKKTCKGERTATGIKRFTHSYRIIHRGGLFTGPEDKNGNNGIIHFVVK